MANLQEQRTSLTEEPQGGSLVSRYRRSHRNSRDEEKLTLLNKQPTRRIISFTKRFKLFFGLFTYYELAAVIFAYLLVGGVQIINALSYYEKVNIPLLKTLLRAPDTVGAQFSSVIFAASSLFLSGFISMFILEWICARVVTRTTRRFLWKLLRQDVDFVRTANTEEIIQAVTDFSLTLNRGLVYEFIFFVTIFFVPTTLVYCSYSVAKEYTKSVLYIVPFYYIICPFIGLILSRIQRRIAHEYSKFQGFINETLKGTRTIQAFNAQGFFIERMHQRLQDFRKFSGKLRIREGLALGSLIFFWTLLSCLGILFFLLKLRKIVQKEVLFATHHNQVIPSSDLEFIRESSQGLITRMQFLYKIFANPSLKYLPMSLFNISISIYQLARLGPAMQTFAELCEILNKMDIVMSRESKLDSLASDRFVPTTCSGAIEFNNVSYQHVENVPLLHNISFKLEPGESLAVLGPSGIGKSTILDLVQRLIIPNAGQIKFDNFDYEQLNLRWLRSQMAIVSQDTTLVRGTIYDNIIFGLEDVSLEDVIDAAKKAMIHDLISALPKGYQSYVKPRGTNFSGGQRQRILIARMLLRKPKVFLMDEATSALDNNAAAYVLNCLQNIYMTANCTSIVVAHKLKAILGTKKVLILGKDPVSGHTVVNEYGLHRELASNPNSMLSAMYLDQFGSIPTGTFFDHPNAVDLDDLDDKLRKDDDYEKIIASETCSESEEDGENSEHGDLTFENQAEDLNNTAQDKQSDADEAGEDENRSVEKFMARETLGSLLKFDQAFNQGTVPLGYNDLQVDPSTRRTTIIKKPRRKVGRRMPFALFRLLSVVCSRFGYVQFLVTLYFYCLMSMNRSLIVLAIIKPFHDMKLSAYKLLITSGLLGIKSLEDGADTTLGPVEFNTYAEAIEGFYHLGHHVLRTIKHRQFFIYFILVMAITMTTLAIASRGHVARVGSTHITEQLYTSLVQQDIAFFDRKDNSPGSLFDVITSDVASVRNVLFEDLYSFCGVFMTITLSICMIWRQNVAVAIAAFIGIACTIPFMKLDASLTTQVTNRNTGKRRLISEANLLFNVVDNFEQVTRYNAQKFILRDLDHLVNRTNKAALLRYLARASIRGMADASTIFFVKFVTLFATHFTPKNTSPIATEFAVTLALFTYRLVIPAFTNTANSKVASESARNILTILNERPHINASSRVGASLNKIESIKLENVSFTYPTAPQTYVFRNVNLAFEKGKTYAIAGPTGCGKSTVLALIERFYDIQTSDEYALYLAEDKSDKRRLPHTGSLLINGKDIRTYNVKELRSRLGLVSQDADLFNISLRDNLTLGLPSNSRTDEEIMQYCKVANFDGKINCLPDGLDTVFKDSLSGGERQRLGIARALIREPDVVLCDEITSALDSTNEQRVVNALKQYSSERDVATVFIAHRLSTIVHADCIYVFDKDENGVSTIVQRGKHEELLRDKNGTYARLYNLEIGIQNSDN